ncbi:hypothetical protein BV22DRAFT_1132056 [Leucogyrophana mollusca]|uniref:Uncharacterized protein n=1 Tax=Leucogyrophana mollusca TaxID=85980 RepID=A0ACB8B7F9_9AGAM|nr:hypothetical protein BV22DRAFT_1132056 [Leucogyrophana mollusca]
METPKSSRTSPRSTSEKINDILLEIKHANWTLSEFLYYLFWLHNDDGNKVKWDPRHRSMVIPFLNGELKYTCGAVLELIYKNSSSVAHTKDDMESEGRMLVLGIDPESIKHARPALTTWAVSLVTKLVRKEAARMAGREAGLQLCAQPKIVEEHAPIMWHIVSSYSNDKFENRDAYTVRIYRPQNLGAADSLLALTFIKTWFASLPPMCCAVYLFATKAHRSLFCVDSRLGRCVSYDTVYTALKTMAKETQKDLQHATCLGSGRHFWVCGDNVQAYAKQRDPWIGQESWMIKGFAGMAVEMEDFMEGAFDMEKLVAKQLLQERDQLTVEHIIADIDNVHLDKVNTLHFIRALAEFVPELYVYNNDLAAFEKTLQKNQIPVTRKTKIIPLATNSADEITVQGMREAVLDFLETQMGFTNENLGNRVIVFSGDGKTFDQLLRLKRLLVMHKGNLQSMWCVALMLELWHTKWTELSRLIQQHWGTGFLGDVSTLGCLAGSAECPTPSDLRKVDFHNGAHLVNLALNAHLLNCWDDLREYFQQLATEGKLPPFQTLLDSAGALGRCHATTQVYKRACNLGRSAHHPDQVPVGAPWTPGNDGDARSEINMEVDGNVPSQVQDVPNDDEERLSDMSTGPKQPEMEEDMTFANSRLFIRSAVRWRESCRAIAIGDTGQVWEMLKLWIFTFAGGGNPNYTQYLLELYCNFKWELLDDLKKAILDNWLVNPHGIPGLFVEMDLLQEHSNFWLEDMAQHKGKEFDDPYY